MGRMVKNTVFSGAAYALGVPTGTSSIGPSNPANAQVRWNTTTSKLEFWDHVEEEDAYKRCVHNVLHLDFHMLIGLN